MLGIDAALVFYDVAKRMCLCNRDFWLIQAFLVWNSLVYYLLFLLLDEETDFRASIATASVRFPPTWI